MNLNARAVNLEQKWCKIWESNCKIHIARGNLQSWSEEKVSCLAAPTTQLALWVMYVLLSALSVGDAFCVENAIGVTDILCQHIEMENLLQS